MKLHWKQKHSQEEALLVKEERTRRAGGLQIPTARRTRKCSRRFRLFFFLHRPTFVVVYFETSFEEEADDLRRRAHELQPATPSVGGYGAFSLGFSFPFNTFFRSLSTLFFLLFWFFSSARASSGGGQRPLLCRRRRRRRDADERSTSSFARQDCAQQLRPRLREDAWGLRRRIWSAASRGCPSPRLGYCRESPAGVAFCCNSPRRPARSAAARATVTLIPPRHLAASHAACA